VAEWSNAPDLKSGVRKDRGFESHPLRTVVSSVWPTLRLEYGAPPDKNGDYALLLHILESLKSTVKAAVILPHYALHRRMQAE
jgi:type I restriction-modification system DNA methylase subunit